MSTTTEQHIAAEQAPSPGDGIRLTHYSGAASVRAIGHELSHLDRIAAVTDGNGQSAWLETIVGHPEYRVTTSSLEGRLVSYAAGTSQDGVITIDRVVVAPAVTPAHPKVLSALVEAFVDGCDAPWAEVRVHAGSAALAPLLAAGWKVTAHDADGTDHLHLAGHDVA